MLCSLWLILISVTANTKLCTNRKDSIDRPLCQRVHDIKLLCQLCLPFMPLEHEVIVFSQILGGLTVCRSQHISKL